MNLAKIRGGAGDITKPDLNARIQDNLYLAVNSDWISSFLSVKPTWNSINKVIPKVMKLQPLSAVKHPLL